MSKTVPAYFATALTSDAVEPFYAVEFFFDDDDGTLYTSGSYLGENTLRLWTGVGDKVMFTNKTFTGAGDLLSISETEETNDLTVRGMNIVLTGVSTDLVNKALAEPYQNRKCVVHLGLTSSGDPVEIFSGNMDVMTIEDSPEASQITLSVEHKLVDLERSVVRRYTEESHKALDTNNANDTFFEFLTDIQDKQISFGKPKS